MHVIMFCKLGRGNAMDSIRSPVHFFKPILSDITPHTTLMIPRKFISECGYDLGESVYLRAPAGSVWQVEVERSTNDLWLGRGWPDFAANYSICFGHFLVFRYEGNSHFHVIIFDNSAAEIEYPLTSEPTYINKGYRKRKEVATTINKVGSVEELRNCPTLIKKKKPVSACTKAIHQLRDWETKVQEHVSETLNKTMRIEGTDDESNDTCYLKASIKSKEHLDGSIKEDRGKRGKRLMQVTSEADKARVLALAKAFKSKNPFFIVKIQPSYLSGQYILTVPKSFVTEYITQDHQNVILRVSDGRDWPVKCYVYGSNAKFTGGWRIFSKKNSLQVGDICVFELINFSANLLKVFIFRAAKGYFRTAFGRDNSAVEIEYPLSTSILYLTDLYNQGYQRRKELAMANNNVGGMEGFANTRQAKDALSMLHHMPSKKIKTVSACVEASHQVRMWEPKLQETAMIQSKKKMKFKVTDDEFDNTCKLNRSIKSEEQHSNGATEVDRGEGGNRLPWVKSEAEKARLVAVAKAFQSENPFFIVKMQPSYVDVKVNMTVPKKFVTKYITQDCDYIILQVSEGRTWPVKCSVNKTTGKFGIGWPIFAEENNLVVGDVCVFELISSSRKLLNVTTFRATGVRDF